MKMWLVAFVVVVPLLAGCGDDGNDNSDIAGVKIENDSEACRAAASSTLDAHGVGGQSEGDKRAAYEHAYHDCMTAKGYPATP